MNREIFDNPCEPKFKPYSRNCYYVVSITGPTEPTGPAAIALSYADFYALMLGDNPATIAPGGAVCFPQDGPNDGTSITRASGTTFTLVDAGTYEVYFDVPVIEAGQLQITVDGTPIDYTFTGRATGTSNISGNFIITTTTANAIISVINAVGNTTDLTITPNACGTEPVSAHLIIKQIA